METWMIWAAIGVAVLFLIVLYNRIIGLKQTRNNAFSDIDVQLKLRHDLIPNLVETVKGYASHEKELLEQVTNARASAMKETTVDGKVAAENQLGAAMFKLMAVAEAYPDLKADQNFRQLQDELSDVENKIAAARRFFNNATNEYNTAIQQFPAVLVANMFKFTEEPFFEMSEIEKEAAEKPPSVSF
jgi:LemA protein|tara:strand:+ start:335 stop:895 length:561 start_codon:yes stop_codon:yes gene_type:complete